MDKFGPKKNEFRGSHAASTNLVMVRNPPRIEDSQVPLFQFPGRKLDTKSPGRIFGRIGRYDVDFAVAKILGENV